MKAGGYGTAGWAIGGDIIVDLSKLVEVDIEPPHPDGSFTSLRDVASANSKGKKAVTGAPDLSPVNTAKRRREDDANLRIYDAASHEVASFLRGPSLSSQSTFDGPSPSVRRRLDIEPLIRPSSTSSRGVSQESDLNPGSSSSEAESGDSNANVSISTATTSPSPARSFSGSGSISTSTGVPGADPFGYLEPSNNFSPPPPVIHSAVNPHAMAWAGGAGSTFESVLGPFGQMTMPVQVEPIYPHAFVTFGAGMRQKEIDTFTAQNKLESRYITGSGDGIPYHVPL